MDSRLPKTIKGSATRKQEQVVDQIVALARQYGAGMKLPTVVELSKSLGVTVSTVDRSLGRLEEMGIVRRKRGSGIYVSSQIDQKRIGLVFGRNVFGSGSSPFYRMLIQCCEQRALRHNEAFSFYLDTPQLGRDEENDIHHDLADALSRGRLDGILVASKRSPEQDRLLRSYGLPMVVLSANTSGYGLVGFDMEFFLEQTLCVLKERGCESIGFISTRPYQREVFEKVTKREGVTVDADWVKCLPGPDIISPDRYEAEGRRLMGALHEANSGRMPDGIIIADDMLARGACDEFERLGGVVGGDVKFAVQVNRGCDVLHNWNDRLIQYEMDSNEVVEAMFTELEALMEQPNEPRPPVFVKGHLKA
ncbi:GntR family transcriptional regulator [Coraliomargarita parva]|uniref:GntR family transcriptional regulator n=1 Tax=Coraliomargarita parva TaxID=3014050 RepID=UPI0022B44647|nr:GntR family transcriptional regulator [Coraliomargarita parva]